MKTMNFRKILLMGVLAGLGVAGAAHAQINVYAGITAERIGGFTPCACASTDGNERPYGGTLGAFYDFRKVGPLVLGVDARGSFMFASKSATSYSASPDLVRHYSGLGGLHVTVRTPFKVLRPYGQVSAGYAKFGDSGYMGHTQVQGYVGLDLALFQYVDLRAIEFGEGELLGTDSHRIQSIGIGLVFHPSRQ